MNLTFIRHEEVEEEFKYKYNGHNDISLSAHGELQAKKLCQKLNALKYDMIFCSDLRRAKETIKNLNHEVIYTNKL